MEIERKFLIERFPDELPLLEQAVVEQGYLATEPTVRIRSVESRNGSRSYKLCIKGDGTLARREVEVDLQPSAYDELKEIVEAPMIIKEYRVYALSGNHRLECSHVDAGTSTAFLYAEVEFATIEQANAFTAPPFLCREVTEETGYSMAAYWERTRGK